MKNNETKPKRMSKRAEKALHASIEHWERLATGKQRKREALGPGDCALCRLYYTNDCKSCPISRKTGEIRCRNTPYNAAYNAAYPSGRPCDFDSPEFRKAARAELRFLRGLLPKGGAA